MKNEIVRKLTSLTLMTIMFAGGLVFAVPGVMPEANAAHNANLFVSAENSFSSNMVTGPMVVEVVVSDSSISSQDDAHGEPTVTMNGQKIRMLQSTDGNWYAYIADVDMAKLADATQPGLSSSADPSTRPGKGLNFGKFCNNDSGDELLGFSLSSTQGVALPSNATFSANVAAGTNGTDGSAAFVKCTATNAGARHSGATSTSNKELNVIRENKTLNRGAATGIDVGQIGLLDSNYWPFIQLYDFVPTGTVVLKYDKAGGTQTTTLTFDTMTGISVNLDRALYPANSFVHLTLQDFQLNIDPTDEDSWSFGSNIRDTTSNKTVFYMLFNDTGKPDADGRAFDIISSTQGTVAKVQVRTNIGAQNLFGNLTSLMFEDNGMLTFNNNTSGTGTDLIKLVNHTDSKLIKAFPAQTTAVSDKQLRTQTIEHKSLPITITETAPNSGIFTSTDESNISTLKINDACISGGLNVCRGKTATLAYDDVSYSILVGTSFATLSMDETVLGGEWNSGETIPVTLVDNDQNLNSKVDEDLDVFNNNTKIIPTISIGSPFTIKSGDNATIWDSLRVGTLQNAGIGFISSSTGALNYWAGGSSVDTFSQRMILTPTFTNANTTFVDLDLRTSRIEMPAITIDLGGRTFADFKSVIKDPRGSTQGKFKGLDMINIDFRSLDQNIDDISTGKGFNATKIYLIGDTGGTDLTFNDIRARDGATVEAISIANTTIFNGLINLNATDTANSGCSGCNVYRNIFAATSLTDNDQIGLLIHFDTNDLGFPSLGTATRPFVIDFFSFGFTNDGVDSTDRINNAIYRLELEETGLNTGTFAGTAEYVMLNQINILTTSTYTSLATISNDVTFIAHEDLTDESAARVDYNDLAGDGSILPTADQQAAPTHSGVVSFDFDNYKIADTVTVTLTDQDLNVDSEVIDIFTVVGASSKDLTGATIADDVAYDQVGAAGYGQNSIGDNFGRLLDITFDDERWLDQDKTAGGSADGTCTGTLTAPSDDGLGATGFTLVETGIATGVFKGDYTVPAQYCARNPSTNTLTSTTGKDMEVNYADYRDASGEIIEVGDGAGIRANTGSVSLDRTVYPVPWGVIGDYASNNPSAKTPGDGTTTRSLFPIHASGIAANGRIDTIQETIGTGDVVVHVRVNDPDFNTSGTGSDFIKQNASSATGTDLKFGPVKIMIQRGTDVALLATAGGAVAQSGVITSGSDPAPLTSGGVMQRTSADKMTRELGGITEVSPDAGIFELDFTVRYTDGPLSTKCPTSTTQYTALDGGTTKNENDRFFALTASGTAATGQFAVNSTSAGRHCILQGDIITVEYRDPTDAAGKINTVTDSATFDLRNGVLQSDKSVYIIGSDMIMTLIEPDFDRDNDTAETYDLDLIEWDSDAAEITMGNLASIRGATTDAAAFDPEPSNFRETGDSTGIFQIVIEIPNTLNSQKLDRGEKVELEYTDWGPSGADFVGEEEQDVNLIIFTSNFGATVELDQKVYTWTDKVFITIVAPDHNFDSNLIDEVGETADDKIIVQTRQAKLENYKLVETGTDTGIFTGEVILAGFKHDADGNTATGDSSGNDITSSTTKTGSGPTDGKLSSTENDGLTVSFEFNEDETVVGSALIRWNIGEVSWLEASYPATGTGVVRVVDPDMNLNPESVDNFSVDVWSDSDAGGIDLTVTETNEATGIFEGTVFFTITDESSGHRLRVAEGDTITGEYEDNTLPDPYTTADELDVTGTSIIGTIVPPLERAPASNARVVDAFGNSLTDVSVDQQVQIAADLSNGQDRDQKFAYLVQIQDESGVTVSLAWITGSLTAGQSFSPALSWIPDAAGTYTATVFVWESVDNPTALSPTVTTSINVS